jgi:hypothetical protein
MIGFKVLTKDGLKGPFRKSSIIKAITAAQIPLQARLLDLETGRYLSAAELVGEAVDHGVTNRAPTPARDDGELRLEEDTGNKE